MARRKHRRSYDPPTGKEAKRHKPNPDPSHAPDPSQTKSAPMGNTDFTRSKNMKRRRRKRKKSHRPSKQMVKYIKNQIAKPDWSGTFRKRQIGMAILDSVINKVEYAELICGAGCSTVHIRGWMNGTDELSYSNVVNGALSVVDQVGGLTTALILKKVRFREDLSYRLKNVSNSDTQFEVIQWECKYPTNQTPLSLMTSAYEVKSGNDTLLKENDFFVDSGKELSSGGDWRILNIRSVHLNPGQASQMDFHTKWRTFCIEEIDQHDQGSFAFQKGSTYCSYRMMGGLTHGSTIATEVGINPSEVVIAYECKTYTQYLSADEGSSAPRTTIGALNAATTIASTAEASHTEPYATT